MNCSPAGNHHLFLTPQPPPPPLPTTTAATIAIYDSLLDHYGLAKHFLLHVQPHRNNNFTPLVVGRHSILPLHHHANSRDHGGGGSGPGGGGRGDDWSDNFFNFNRNSPFLLSSQFSLRVEDDPLCFILPKLVSFVLISLSASASYFILSSSAALAKTNDLSGIVEDIVSEMRGEAQGMVSKSIGILLGISLANCVQSSTPLALSSFGVIHVLQSEIISIHTAQDIKPHRATLVFSQYLLRGLVPSVKEVNDEEPLFPAFPLLNMKPASEEHDKVLSTDANDAAFHIDRRLQLGSKLSDVVNSKEDAIALFDLYKDEGYILTELEGRYCVSYLYWLERKAGIKPSTTINDCRLGGGWKYHWIMYKMNSTMSRMTVKLPVGLSMVSLLGRCPRIGGEPASLPTRR